MIITNAQTIDLKKYNTTKTIYAVQDDKYSRNLELTLLSGGDPWEIPEDISVLIRYSKADGTGGVYDTMPDESPAWSATDNILTIALAPQVLTTPGPVSLSVTLLRGQTQLNTCSIYISVAEAVNAQISESKEYIHVHGLLPAPAIAAPGQYLRVSAVDSAGHVVAVDAAAMESDSSSNAGLIERTAKIELSGNIGLYAQPDGLLQEQVLEMYLHAPIKLNKNMKTLRMVNVRVNPYIAKVVYSNSPELEKWNTVPAVVLEGNDGDIIDCDIAIDTSYQYMFITSCAASSGYIQDDGTEYYIISSVPDTQMLIQLADQYEIAIGDTLELFFSGIVNVGNIGNYIVECTCEVGNAYRKRYVYTPKSEETGNIYLFTLTLKDDFGNILESAASKIKVINKALSAVSGNILCVGDSLTANGIWVTEFRNRLSADGFQNAVLIGSQGDHTAKHEGHSGHGYGAYLSASAGNPFWNSTTGQIDFSGYMDSLGLSGQAIDYCILLLGWNETALSETAFKNNVEAFCTNLRNEYPDCKILFVGLQIPSLDGFGDNYGCMWHWKEKRDFVHDLDRWYQDLSAVVPNSKTVQLCSQFDTENNMPTGLRQVNRRNPALETYGTNGIHPDRSGYLQIADAVYRSILAF